MDDPNISAFALSENAFNGIKNGDTASSSESEAECYLNIHRRIYGELDFVSFHLLNPVFFLFCGNGISVSSCAHRAATGPPATCGAEEIKTKY